ncbi:MAG: GxxExxY protein [Planctomycetes bacterium]|nr:GxxExxY protein [Planctomycetota bacterium]
MLHSDLTGRILGCAVTVHRALGSGYPESMYQAALDLEFRAQGLRFVREAPIVVLYRDREIGQFRADFILEDLVVLETKALASLGKGENRQLLNYLHVSDYEVGLLVNFGTEKIEVTRRIFTNEHKSWMTRPEVTAIKEVGDSPEISGVRKNRGRVVDPREAGGEEDRKDLRA